MCAMTGRSITGTIGFGISKVSGRRRVPRPAARTMAFMRRVKLAECAGVAPRRSEDARDDDDQADEAKSECGYGRCEEKSQEVPSGWVPSCTHLAGFSAPTGQIAALL